MKKGLKWLVYVLLVCITSLCFMGCASKTVKTECAPCTVREIWAGNQEVYEEFFGIRTMTNVPMDYFFGGAVKWEVDGEELGYIDIILTPEDLTEGEHTIVLYTEKDFTISMNGEIAGEYCTKDIPYEKKITVKVTVSSDYEDIYDMEYREQNGLWTGKTIQDEEWYQHAQKEWEKTVDKVFS